MPRHRDICLRFGERLRLLRQRRGWSQEELAAKSGIGRPFLSDLENGKREPCLRSLEILADTFECANISQLLRGV